MNHFSKWRMISWQSLGVAFLAIALVAASVFVAQQSEVDASSHREAPLLSKDPYADNTDTYVFVSPTNPDNLVLVASWIPFEGPEGGPNYFEWDDNVKYDINIDNNGDAVPDYTYSLSSSTEVVNPLTFLYNVGTIGLDGANWNRTQRYSITETSADGDKVLLADAMAPPVNIGSKSTPDFEALADSKIYDVNEAGDDIKIYAGQTDDAFWVDLQVFDLLTLRGQDAPIGYAMGSNTPVDSLAGFNVHTLVIEVPISRLTQGEEPVLGVWATASRPSMRVLDGLAGLGGQTNSGDFVQVSRLGMPLVNEAVLPYALKDAFNTLKPEEDLSIYTHPDFGPILQKSVEDPELGNLLCGLYGVPLPGDSDGDCSTEFEAGSPRTGRGDIFDIFLTGMVLASEFTINTADGPVTLPAGFNVNQPAGVVPSEMIRINTNIKGGLCSPTPSILGVLGGDACGFPNGRRLMDDVVEIELLAVAGAAYQVLDGRDADFAFTPGLIGVLNDGLDFNDKPFRDDFPFVATAHSGQEHIHTNSMAATVEMKSTISRVDHRKSDAEEYTATGRVRVNSNDLELGTVDERDQFVGIRFTDVELPAGATVTGAYIQFVAEEDDDDAPTSLTFKGETNVDADQFNPNNGSISSRATTSASVDWADVPAWESKEAKAWTPNLAAVVQEVVAQDGWESGKTLSFIVTGTGSRSAYAYDGKRAAAPLLYLEYTMGDGNMTDGLVSAASISPAASMSSSVVSSSLLDTRSSADEVEAADDDASEGGAESSQVDAFTLLVPLVTQ